MHAGRLWFGTHGALWRVDHPDDAAPRARRMATGLPDDTNYLGACPGADGAMWFATSHGLLRYAHAGFTPIRLRGGLPGGGLVDVAITGADRLWMAPAEGGLWLGSVPSAGATAVAARPVDDALLRHDALYSLDVDRAGRLWAAGAAASTCSNMARGAASTRTTDWPGTTWPPGPSSTTRTARCGWAPAAAFRTCCTRNG